MNFNRTWGAFAGFCLLFSACAPSLIWTAKSRDRSHNFQIKESAGRQSMYLDDRLLGRHDGIAVSTFAETQGGRKWSYAARNGKKWNLVHQDGTIGNWDGFGEVAFSPGSGKLTFTAERKGRWHVVFDGIEGPAFDAVLKGSLRFNRDGSHIAYAVKHGEKAAVVFDQSPGPQFDGIGTLTFGEGTRLAYTVREENRGFVILDGKIGPPYEEISELRFNHAGDQLAYIARKQDRWVANVEGFESRPFDHLHSLVFSPDGQFIAFAAREGNDEYVVKNGLADSLRFQSIKAGSMGFRPGKQALSFTAYVEKTKSWHVYIDGNKIAEETWAGSPVFGTNGNFGYVANRDKKMAVVVSGQAYKFDLIIDDTFLFNPDGNHWGCIAGSGIDRDFFFVIDGQKYRRLDFGEIASLTLQDPIGQNVPLIRNWVAAELELASSPDR